MEEDFFDQTRLDAMRREIIEQGVFVDTFLPNESDDPVFGVNLACAHPFPEGLRLQYNSLATCLAELDPDIYVYPFWETHLTIMTLINFTRYRSPSETESVSLKETAEEAIQTIAPLFLLQTAGNIGVFKLKFQQPVLSRKSIILPLDNPTGEIGRIRSLSVELLRRNPTLLVKLEKVGLNVPSIIHSTISRFKAPPKNLKAFLSGFDSIAARTDLGFLTIKEIFVTTETKPYMRGGEVIRRFPLAEIS